ncbi:RNase H domain-containing protein [Trichonephila clavipes]|nr:RNase H domain-containing protein [Trichonephila clavipes]
MVFESTANDRRHFAMRNFVGLEPAFADQVIAGIPLDAAKIYTDGSKGETNTTGSGVLIELTGHVIKLQKRNADHASVFRTEQIAIMCGLLFINNIRDLAVSENWILTYSRSSIQHLSNWPSIGDSTSRSILHLFQQLSDRHPIHLQWVPSHVGLLGNEVADDLAKAATSNPVDPENHMALTSTEIISRAKELICRTWVVPPVLPWYFQRHPGSAISFKGSRSYQTAFSRFSTGHLSTFCNVWGFSVRRLLHPPAILRLRTDLWTHGSSLYSFTRPDGD